MSISSWALRRELGWLSSRESAHSIVADDVSVPADSIPCLCVFYPKLIDGQQVFVIELIVKLKDQRKIVGRKEVLLASCIE